MHQPHLLSDDEYYDIATEPTSNEMFDNGAWLAPVLSSRDPGVEAVTRAWQQVPGNPYEVSSSVVCVSQSNLTDSVSVSDCANLK